MELLCCSVLAHWIDRNVFNLNNMGFALRNVLELNFLFVRLFTKAGKDEAIPRQKGKGQKKSTIKID